MTSTPSRAEIARDLELEREYNRRFGAAVVIPAKFSAFCDWLGVELQPGQRAIARVIFDGEEPSALVGTEREIARACFGEIDVFPESARRDVVLVCGARGGKTYVFIALRMLHLALTVDLSTMAPGQFASAPITAPDKDLASEVLRYIQGAVASKPELAAMVLGKPDAAEWVRLRRPDGNPVEIPVRAASARGRTGRGRSLVGAALDEAALFRDDAYEVNDAEIVKGLSPRILPGGQMIVASTPWSRSGVLHDMFEANHPNPEVAGLTAKRVCEGTAMAVHAPTLRLRDVPVTRQIVAHEEASDPDNAAREYGAQFVSAGTSDFFEPAAIAACLDESIKIQPDPLPEIEVEAAALVQAGRCTPDKALEQARASVLKRRVSRPYGVETVAGGDMGFTKNSSALAIGYLDPNTIVTRVADFIERRPKSGEPLRPGVVSREFADLTAAHGGTHLVVDGHYRETVVEHASPVGLAVVPAPASPAVAFVAVRARMRQGLYRFPNHSRFLRQMREAKSRPAPGGGLQIVLKKWPSGEHGDLLSAFVNMAWQAAGAAAEAPPPPPPGTPARAEYEGQRMLERDDERFEADRSEREREERWERMFGG